MNQWQMTDGAPERWERSFMDAKGRKQTSIHPNGRKGRKAAPVVEE